MPPTSPEELPAESVMRLYRAIGLRELCELLGWEYREAQNEIHLPAAQFKTPRNLLKLCNLLDIPLDEPIENQYLDVAAWNIQWNTITEPIYNLYLKGHG